MSLKHLTNYVKALNDEIKKSLIWYTGVEFVNFNKKLRENTGLNKIEKTHYNNIIKAFEGAPFLTEQITVYRGVNKDMNLSSKSFISTSLHPRVAMKFIDKKKRCCIYDIIILPGKISVLPLEGISINKGEHEILLPLDGSLKVLDIILAENDDQGIKRYNAIYLPNNILTIKPEEINNVSKKKEIKVINNDDKLKRLLDNINIETITEYMELEICDTKDECFEELFEQLDFKNTISKELKNKFKRLILNIY